MTLSNNSGIYSITFPSGGNYIGSAKNLRLRYHSHVIALRKRKHGNPILQNAWNKYGEMGFCFKPLLICSIGDLLFYEQRAIDGLKPKYNLCPIAGNTLGLKWSLKSRRKQAERVRGSKASIETRKKQSEAIKASWLDSIIREKRITGSRGRKFSKTHKAKLSAAAKGKQKSPEHCKALSLARIGKPSSRLGISHSQKTRRQISAKLKGRKRSPEAIAKHRATMLARRLEKNDG